MCCRVYANLLQLWLLAQHIQLQQVSTVIHTIVWNDLCPVNLVFNRLVCYWLCHRSPPISWQSPFMTRWKKQLFFSPELQFKPPTTTTTHTHQGHTPVLSGLNTLTGGTWYYQAPTPTPGAHGIIPVVLQTFLYHSIFSSDTINFTKAFLFTSHVLIILSCILVRKII